MIVITGKVKLFKSHHPEIGNGHQKRDFIYVKDLLKVIDFLGDANAKTGIYNLGTGQTRTFLDLVNCIFKGLRTPPQIEFIETPIQLRKDYQYFTEASIG